MFQEFCNLKIFLYFSIYVYNWYKSIYKFKFSFIIIFQNPIVKKVILF